MENAGIARSFTTQTEGYEIDHSDSDRVHKTRLKDSEDLTPVMSSNNEEDHTMLLGNPSSMTERETLLSTENAKLREEVNRFRSQFPDLESVNVRLAEAEDRRTVELEGIRAELSELQSLRAHVIDLEEKLSLSEKRPVETLSNKKPRSDFCLGKASSGSCSMYSKKNTFSSKRNVMLNESETARATEFNGSAGGSMDDNGVAYAEEGMHDVSPTSASSLRVSSNRFMVKLRRLKADSPMQSPRTVEEEKEVMENEKSNAADDKKEEEDIVMRSFPEDTYSYMIVTKPWTLPFLIGLVVFALQIATYTFLISSTIDAGDPKNPFHIPVNVGGAVRCVQLIAILIASISQASMRTGLSLLGDGYTNTSIGQEFPDASVWQWMGVIILRLIEGMYSIFVAFILIIISDEVLDLLLNFTAMEFMSFFSEVVYMLSIQGFAGFHTRIVGHQLSTTEYQIHKTKVWIPRNLVNLIIAACMITGWIFVINFQTSGQALCSVVFVQFGDELLPSLGTFSGLYERRSSPGGAFNAQRVYYVERSAEGSVLGYCEHLEAWTLSLTDGETIDPCNWLARSDTSDSFEFTDTGALDWFVRDDDNKNIFLDYMFTSCFDCGDEACSGRGQCSDAVCTCQDGWYGLRCEFEQPCGEIQIDTRFKSFDNLVHRKWSTEYNVLELDDTTVDVYHRPVFYHEYQDGLFDLIFFTGRRWVLTFSQSLQLPQAEETLLEKIDSWSVGVKGGKIDEDVERPIDVLAKYLRDDFHAYWSNYSVAYLTGPMDVGTIENSVSPVGFTWYAAQARTTHKEKDVQSPDLSLPSPAVFLCSVCNDDSNLCWFDGQCVNGTCECAIDADGALCQIPPLGNGRCDTFYNTPEYFYDEGDCCESTCVSAKFQCGTDVSGFKHVGYSMCDLDLADWSLAANVIRGDALSGFSVVLSGNARFLAIGEPGQDRVRLYDREGSEWIERESMLRGTVGSQFGASVALSRGALGVVNNPISIAPMMVAVGQPSGLVRVFQCTIEGCPRVGASLVAGRGDNTELDIALDLSNDGRVVAMSKTSSTALNPVTVYDLLNNRRWVERTPALPIINAAFSVSLSGSGDLIAVGWESEDRSAIYQTYAWNGTSWDVHGNAIVHNSSGISSMDEVMDSIVHHSQSIALSKDGTILAVGKSSLYGSGAGVDVFVWQNMEWVQRGDTIRSGSSVGGWAIDLSNDGSVVAVGTGRQSGKDKMVRIFQWDGDDDSWVRRGDPVAGGSECAVSLSSDGYSLAVGLPVGRNDGQGRTSVYQFPRQKCPIDASSVFHFSLTTDEFPGETSWDIMNWNTSQMLLEGGPYDVEYATSTFAGDVCVSKQVCTIFTIYDKVGLDFVRSRDLPNGIEPPGDYALFMNGNEIIADGQNTFVFDYFPYFQRVYTGQCPTCGDDDNTLRMMVTTCIPVAWEFFDNSDREVFKGSNAQDFDLHDIDYECVDGSERTYWEETCLPVDACGTFSLFALPKSVAAIFRDALPERPGILGSPSSGQDDDEEVIAENLAEGRGGDDGVLLEDEGVVTEEEDDGIGNRKLGVRDTNLAYLLLLDDNEISYGNVVIDLEVAEPMVQVNVGNCVAQHGSSVP